MLRIASGVKIISFSIITDGAAFDKWQFVRYDIRLRTDGCEAAVTLQKRRAETEASRKQMERTQTPIDEISDEPVYVISVAARLAGLKTWYLRVLNDAGIVVPKRTDGNRRLYSARDIARLARIQYLTVERHVNLEGVKVIFELEAAWDAERTGRSVEIAPEKDDSVRGAPPTAVRDVLALLPAYTPDTP